MNVIDGLRFVALSSVLALAACEGESEEETSSDAVTTFVRGAEFREKVEACDAQSTPASQYACLTAANDAENEHLDEMQQGNAPKSRFAGYRTSDVPAYRDGALTLCNALAGEPVRSRESSETASCLAKRERALASLILDTVYSESSAATLPGSFQSACEQSAAAAAAPASDRALKDAKNALERSAECARDSFLAKHRPKVSATFESCSPVRHDETTPRCRAISVLDWTVQGTNQVCQVLGTAGQVGKEYEIARAQHECIAKALVLLEATPL